MFKNTIRKAFFSAIFITSIMVLLAGCSNSDSEKELAAFSQSITNFSDYMTSMDEKISNLDYTKDSACEDLLSYLDGMNSAFSKLADMSVPEQYASIAPLADEASENMSQAVALYHSALEDGFHKDDADVAYQYYTRAMMRISYIGTILQGEIPEGDNITVYETNVSNELIDKIAE